MDLGSKLGRGKATQSSRVSFSRAVSSPSVSDSAGSTLPGACIASGGARKRQRFGPYGHTQIAGGKEKLTKALGAPALPYHRDEETGDDGPLAVAQSPVWRFAGFPWDGIDSPVSGRLGLCRARHIHQLGPRDAIMPGTGTGTHQKPPVTETAGSLVDVKDQQRGKSLHLSPYGSGQAKSSASRHAMNASQPPKKPSETPNRAPRRGLRG